MRKEPLLDFAARKVIEAKGNGKHLDLEYMGHTLSTDNISSVEDAYMQVFGQSRQETIDKYGLANLMMNPELGKNTKTLDPNEMSEDQLELVGSNSDVESRAQLLNNVTKATPDQMREIAEGRRL